VNIIHRTCCLTAMMTMCLLPLAERASAQIGNRLAIGGSVTVRVADSPGAASGASPNFELRIGHEQPGWGPAISLFNWFDLGVQASSPALAAPLGSLRMRPIMGGVGYTKVRGRTTLTADLLGGFSLNGFEPAPGQGTDGHASNVFTLKPGVTVWHDLNDRFALKLEGGYLIARPTVTYQTAAGRVSRDVDADVFLVTVGLVYSLF
jgi:hypothetical protein